MDVGFVNIIKDTLTSVGIILLLFIIYDSWGE